MKKLWQDKNLHPLIEQYTAQEDIKLDQALVDLDIKGSLAHAQMLEDQGLISSQAREELEKLKDIHLQDGDEDVHTRIENELGSAGKELHMGRSRNDQVLVDMRMFNKQKIKQTALLLLNLAEQFLKQAEKNEFTALPGMTHMQTAMLSSFGLWLGSFVESLLDDEKILFLAYQLNDQSPLGSGAGYGVNVAIDREKTAKLLGFSKIQNNALYCQNSRGKIDGVTLHALVQVMLTLNKWASDCLLFTTHPFSYITFPDELSTGSSIMPQKKNWDALELMRAKYHQVLSLQTEVLTLSANLCSGYNRDNQQTKRCIMTGFQQTISSLEVANLFISNLQIKKMGIPKELFAAHWANTLDLPFRDAYSYVKENLDKIPNFSVDEALREVNSLGGPGNLQLDKLKKQIKKQKQKYGI